MRRIAASLAALIAVGLAGCGDEGAEPDAPVVGVATPVSLELILDFQPNAVHSGIYVASERGLFDEAGLRIEIREPGASTDAPKLLRGGRADLAILDIHDLAIARERGVDLVGIGAIVQRPLASVIAADAGEVEEPADLAGATIGVTGLPSDDAVLASILDAGGLTPADVRPVTIGFEAIAGLSSGRLGAATAFWNAEGVILREEIGLPTREFRVDEFGAPPYPELVLVTTPQRLAADRDSLRRVLAALEEGYDAVVADPGAALDDLLTAVPELDRAAQRAQLDAVVGALGESRALDPAVLELWADWDLEHGIVESRPDVEAAFELDLTGD